MTIDSDSRRLQRLNSIIRHARERNDFYRSKWSGSAVPDVLSSFAQLREFPLVTRAELAADQERFPPIGTNLSASARRLVRISRSSGTSGRPIFWAETSRERRLMAHCSARLLSLAGIKPGDSLLLAARTGASAGSSVILDGIEALGCAALLCNPEDVHLIASLAHKTHATCLIAASGTLRRILNADEMIFRRVIVAGSRTSGMNALREQARALWNAECFDRYGMTEAGSIAGECTAHRGMHVLDDSIHVECIEPITGKPVSDEQPGELVITSLVRSAMPLIRYRTGDFAKFVQSHRCECKRMGAMIVGEVSRGPNSICDEGKHASSA